MKYIKLFSVMIIVFSLVLSFSGCGNSNSSSSSSDQAAREQAQKEQEEKNQRNKELNDTFPHADAAKAISVAMTNSVLGDVFMADGSTYDPSKFHNYSWCTKNGLLAATYTFEARDNQWLIAFTLEQMENGKETNRRYTGTAYVSLVDGNYVVTQPHLSYKTFMMNGSEITSEVLDQGPYPLMVDDGDAALTVSPELLK